MPVTENVYQVLEGNRTPQECVADLMGRAPKRERHEWPDGGARCRLARGARVAGRHGRLVDSSGPRGTFPRRADTTSRPAPAPPAPRVPGGGIGQEGLPVHLRVGHRGPPRQGRRPDLRRRPRRDPRRGPLRPRRLRDPRDHRPRRRRRRDHHRDLRRHPQDRARDHQGHRLHDAPSTASTTRPAACSSPSTSSRPTSPRASTQLRGAHRRQRRRHPRQRRAPATRA